MKKNRPVDKLYKAIANAEKKLADIRKKCKHKKTRTEWIYGIPGPISNANLCDTCDAVVLIPPATNTFGGAQTTTMTIGSGALTFPQLQNAVKSLK
jgi:hypothetical protein